jgi:undecaprenyl pyrophosphate phosphatase UppP
MSCYDARTSRSAASIIGGMQQGLTRHAAAEFSSFWQFNNDCGYMLFSFLEDL